MATLGFQLVRASGEEESRVTIAWRQTARRDAKLWRWSATAQVIT
jgi:hypothetical protein